MNKLEAKLVESQPVRSLIERSKNWILPGFEKLPFYEVCKLFISQVQTVGVSLRASSIAFHFLMAIPAGTIFLCTLIPYMPVSKQITVELLQLADAFTRIAEELRRQYSLGYYPKTENADPNDRREIKVKVKQSNLAVKARESYLKSSTRGPNYE